MGTARTERGEVVVAMGWTNLKTLHAGFRAKLEARFKSPKPLFLDFGDGVHTMRTKLKPFLGDVDDIADLRFYLLGHGSAGAFRVRGEEKDQYFSLDDVITLLEPHLKERCAEFSAKRDGWRGVTRIELVVCFAGRSSDGTVDTAVGYRLHKALMDKKIKVTVVARTEAVVGWKEGSPKETSMYHAAMIQRADGLDEDELSEYSSITFRKHRYTKVTYTFHEDGTTPVIICGNSKGDTFRCDPLNVSVQASRLLWGNHVEMTISDAIVRVEQRVAYGAAGQDLNRVLHTYAINKNAEKLRLQLSELYQKRKNNRQTYEKNKVLWVLIGELLKQYPQ